MAVYIITVCVNTIYLCILNRVIFLCLASFPLQPLLYFVHLLCESPNNSPKTCGSAQLETRRCMCLHISVNLNHLNLCVISKIDFKPLQSVKIGGSIPECWCAQSWYVLFFFLLTKNISTSIITSHVIALWSEMHHWWKRMNVEHFITVCTLMKRWEFAVREGCIW